MIGIDPGIQLGAKAGGIFFSSEQGNRVYAMPSEKVSFGRRTDFIALHSIFKNEMDDIDLERVAYIEEPFIQKAFQRFNPIAGKREPVIVRSEKLWENFGACCQVCTDFNIRVALIRPKNWETIIFGNRLPSQRYPDIRKKLMLSMAETLYPDLKDVLRTKSGLPHTGKVCAVLIGHSGILMEGKNGQDSGGNVRL